MDSAAKHLLSIYPKRGRLCNLGFCPAFTMTDRDAEYAVAGSVKMAMTGKTAEEVAEEDGIPSGECRITRLERVVNERCVVDDNRFVDYYRNL